MNNRKSQSGEVAEVTTFRITDNDKNTIAATHGTLTKFLNDAVEKEVKRLQKKSVKTRSKSKS